MYCMLLIEIKDFNELIDNKSFFDQPVKKYIYIWKLVKMSRKDGYTKGNLSNYVYHQNKYKLIGIDISRRKKQVFLNKVIS